MKRLAILGAGDLGQLIARHAPSCGFAVVGFYDDTRPPGSATDGGPILGPLSALDEARPGASFDGLALGIGYRHMAFRAACFERLAARFPFPPLVHPSCVVATEVPIGAGSFLLPGCVLDVGVRVGSNVVLNTACVVAHDTTIEDHSFLGPGVTLAGFVTVRRCAFLGIRTVVINGVVIGSGVQTGGGALVAKDLLEPGLYVGVPARKLR